MSPAVRTAPEPNSATPGGAAELWRHRGLLWAFVVTELKNRYVGSAGGLFWSVITPLLELVIYTFVFHVLIGVRFHPAGGWTSYALYLFCGMVTWLSMSDALVRATTIVREYAHLIKKVNFPSVVLPAHVVAGAVVNQIIRLGVLAAGALVLGVGLSWHALLVPLVLVVQMAFTLGLGLMLCTVAVYFRDTVHWINAALLLWMFLTPIFYPAAAYPRRFILLLQLNPMAHLVGVYQELLLNHRLPHPHSMLVAAVMAGFALLVGWSVFSFHRERFADLV